MPPGTHAEMPGHSSVRANSSKLVGLWWIVEDGRIAKPAYKLCILLASHPDRGDVPRVCALARAALADGVDTFLYLIDDGALAYPMAEIPALKDDGLKLYVCAYGAMNRGISPDDGAVFGGLSLLGSLIEASDRLVSFS